MMNAVDKYSTDIIADNEMIIAVDDVVKKDYDSAVVRIKKALARLKSTGHVEKYAEIHRQGCAGRKICSDKLGPGKNVNGNAGTDIKNAGYGI